jgi:hypothetical protein
MVPKADPIKDLRFPSDYPGKLDPERWRVLPHSFHSTNNPQQSLTNLRTTTFSFQLLCRTNHTTSDNAYTVGYGATDSQAPDESAQADDPAAP